MELYKKIKAFATVFANGPFGNSLQEFSGVCLNSNIVTDNRLLKPRSIPDLGTISVTAMYQTDYHCIVQVHCLDTGKCFSCTVDRSGKQTWFGVWWTNKFDTQDVELHMLVETAHAEQNEGLNKIRRADYDPCENWPVAHV